jgi:hypothetical protein
VSPTRQIPHGVRWFTEIVTDGSRTTQPLDYQQAFARIRAEFCEMPGMRLTAAQVQRLCGQQSTICLGVLDELVRAGFLSVSPDGTYCRLSDA